MISYKKFRSLDICKQHKECALCLRTIYEKKLQNIQDVRVFLSIYEKYTHWIGYTPIYPLTDYQGISQQYHLHLRAADMQLKEHNLLPSVQKKDTKAKKDFSPIVIYLDNIRSAYNVGSIVRSTEALRIGSIYFGGNTPNMEHPKVIKTSMETASITPYKVSGDISSLPHPIIALETIDKAIDLADFIFPKEFTLVLGNEEFGISDSLLEVADNFITIPLYGMKNSMNVACAYAIAAAEIRRQHNLV